MSKHLGVSKKKQFRNPETTHHILFAYWETAIFFLVNPTPPPCCYLNFSFLFMQILGFHNNIIKGNNYWTKDHQSLTFKHQIFKQQQWGCLYSAPAKIWHYSLVCPFQELGCKFVHEYSPMCTFGSSCCAYKCSYRHEATTINL